MAQHDQAHQTRYPLLTKADPGPNCPRFSQPELTAQWGKMLLPSLEGRGSCSREELNPTRLLTQTHPR